jgi:hypothetical protein
VPPWRRWRARTRGRRRRRRRCAFRLRLCGRCDTGRRRRFGLHRRSGRRNWRLRLDRRSSRRNWRLRLHGCRRRGDRGLRRNRRRRGRRSGALRRCGCRRLMSWGWRLVRRRRRRRRCGRLWRCDVRRWRNSMRRWWQRRRGMRCRRSNFGGRRVCGGRRALRRRLGFAVIRLRHNQRPGLRVQGWACKLHRRKSCRGKQHETKSGHDDLDPRQIIDNKIR